MEKELRPGFGRCFEMIDQWVCSEIAAQRVHNPEIRIVHALLRIRSDGFKYAHAYLQTTTEIVDLWFNQRMGLDTFYSSMEPIILEKYTITQYIAQAKKQEKIPFNKKIRQHINRKKANQKKDLGTFRITKCKI